MSQLVAYEVQCYSAGDWVIQSIFDDKELALMEARRMEESGLRRQETRVVKEIYDQNQDRTRSQVIYESPMVRTETPSEPARQGAKRPPAPAVKPKAAAARRKAPRRPPKSTGPSFTTIMLSAIGFLVIAFAAIYTLKMMG